MPNLVRIYVGRVSLHQWTAAVGLYPVGAPNHYYSLRGPGEGEGGTQEEAVREAIAAWRMIRDEQREDSREVANG